MGRVSMVGKTSHAESTNPALVAAQIDRDGRRRHRQRQIRSRQVDLERGAALEFVIHPNPATAALDFGAHAFAGIGYRKHYVWTGPNLGMNVAIGRPA